MASPGIINSRSSSIRPSKAMSKEKLLAGETASQSNAVCTSTKVRWLQAVPKFNRELGAMIKELFDVDYVAWPHTLMTDAHLNVGDSHLKFCLSLLALDQLKKHIHGLWYDTSIVAPNGVSTPHCVCFTRPCGQMKGLQCAPAPCWTARTFYHQNKMQNRYQSACQGQQSSSETCVEWNHFACTSAMV